MEMDSLKEYLLRRFEDAKICSGGKEVSMRCRFCGDSQSDKNARHLYIKISGNIPYYNCFKCGSKGVLSPDILKQFIPTYDDNDIAMFAEMSKYLGNEYKKLRNTINKRTRKYSIVNPWYLDQEQDKIDYINSRLGIRIPNPVQDKIVANLAYLLDYNGIREYTRATDIVYELGYSSVGFLSMDNSHLVLKNLHWGEGLVHPNIDNKYNLYTIHEGGVSFYTIPSVVYLNIPAPVDIHVAEGPFDILSICYNVCGNNRENNVYTAACGKGYENVIQMYLLDYNIMNARFHVYLDNDVEDSILYYISNILKALDMELYIHRNTYPGEKDYGVDRAHIIDSVKRII